MDRPTTKVFTYERASLMTSANPTRATELQGALLVIGGSVSLSFLVREPTPTSGLPDSRESRAFPRIA